MITKFFAEALFLLLLTVIIQYFLVEALNPGYELFIVFNEAKTANNSQEDIDAVFE